MKKMRLAVFGAGEYGKKIEAYCTLFPEQYEIVVFADNYPEGKNMSAPVVRPQELCPHDFDKILCATIHAKGRANMRAQLARECKLPEAKIADEEEMYLFFAGAQIFSAPQGMEIASIEPVEEEAYAKTMNNIRACLALHTEEALQEAGNLLKGLEDVYPYPKAYYFLLFEYYIQKGIHIDFVRSILDNVSSEYYEEDEMAEVWRLKQMTYEAGSLGYRQCAYCMALYGDENAAAAWETRFAEEKRRFLQASNVEKHARIKDLAEEYLVHRDTTMYVVLMLLWCKLDGKLEQYADYIDITIGHCNSCLPGVYAPNVGYIIKVLREEAGIDFHIIGEAGMENLDEKLLAFAIGEFGRQARYSEVDAAAIDSYPVDESKCSLVFAPEGRLQALLDKRAHKKGWKRLTDCQGEKLQQVMAFAVAGSYVAYLSLLYDTDVERLLNQPPSVDISVVIPVRNNADTLRATLKTCLEQEFDGTYEILVSDNSDADRKDIEELCATIRDSHIRYIRTPFPLYLSKSFEFAYLQARGAFIFSIGADDGIFPWSLQRMQDSVRQMGKSEILVWNEAYCNYPSLYQEGAIGLLTYFPPQIDSQQDRLHSLYEIDTREILEYLFDYSWMKLPRLYLNSGFKRIYLNTLLQKTGRLWDEKNQDVAMIASHLYCNKNIVYCDEMLSLAGASRYSVGGATETKPLWNPSGEKNFSSQELIYSMGQVIRDKCQRIIPMPWTEGNLYAGILWQSIARLENISGERIPLHVPLLELYSKVYMYIAIANTSFYKEWHEILYSAARLGNAEESRQMQETFRRLCKPHRILYRRVEAPKLQEGREGLAVEKELIGETGEAVSETLLATRVRDAYDAVRYICRKSPAGQE